MRQYHFVGQIDDLDCQKEWGHEEEETTLALVLGIVNVACSTSKRESLSHVSNA